MNSNTYNCLQTHVKELTVVDMGHVRTVGQQDVLALSTHVTVIRVILGLTVGQVSIHL